MLHLPAALHSQLIEAAATNSAEEVCGLVAGLGTHAEAVLPITNALHRSDAFDMDPAELIAAMRWLRENARDLVAIYHSHPTSAPYPSATDQAQNQYPDTPHLIIGREAGEWRVRGFRITSSEIVEIGLQITDPQ